MNEKFNSAEKDEEISFKFETFNGFIEIHIDTKKCSKGWSIIPHQENPTNVEGLSIENHIKVSIASIK